MSNSNATAMVMAGIPESNNALYHRIRFLVGDPAALVELPGEGHAGQSVLILRDIEMGRARRHARADRVACPADFTPEGGLSGDRETATAQATAECLRRAGITHAVADRTMPLIFAHHLTEAGIEVRCDLDLGVRQRRAKDDREVEHIQHAQQVTEGAIRLACEMVARADARSGGVLTVDGQPLTAERVRAAVDVWLLGQGFSNPTSIIAPGPMGADCHNAGSGEIRTGQPVIVDIFPRDRETRYNGDCTRTVVHGDVPDQLVAMHAAVVDARARGIAALRAGVTGEAVHRATIGAVTDAGFSVGLPPDDAPDSYCAMTHGTGHGLGLEVHEPPLLDFGGPELVAGDVITIEPGIYTKTLGGVRVEDLLLVTEEGSRSFNRLPDGLSWA